MRKDLHAESCKDNQVSYREKQEGFQGIPRNELRSPILFPVWGGYDTEIYLRALPRILSRLLC